LISPMSPGAPARVVALPRGEGLVIGCRDPEPGIIGPAGNLVFACHRAPPATRTRPIRSASAP
jgi:hypothetical protein